MSMPKTACEFIAALLIIAKAWKQPRWSLIGKKINELLYIHALEYYSVIKRSYQAMKRYI